MTATLGAPGRDAPTPAAGPGTRPGRDPLVSMVVADGALLALIVAWDGSPGWRVLRAAAVIGLAAAATLAVRRPAVRGHAALAAAWGVVSLVVGLGIGVWHLSKGSVTPLSVAGLGTAVIGVALLVVAARRALRWHRGWRRLALGASGVVVVAVVAWTFVPAVMATNMPPMEAGGGTPADVGLPYRDLVLTTDDGVQLAAWYVPSSNGAAVILRHGASSSRASVLDHAAVLAAHGYGVLITDARGHGDSEGRAMAFGWYGDRDIDAALDALGDRPDVDPDRIGIVGLSMGGEEALGASALDARLAAVVAEGATARSDRDVTWLSDDHGARGWLQEQLDRAQYTLVDLLTDAGRPTALADAVARTSSPVLVIAASEVDDEVRVARHLREAAPERVETWVVDGAGHTDGLDTAPDEWEQRVVTFLDAALLVHAT